MFPQDNGSQIQAYPTAMLWVGIAKSVLQVFERATTAISLLSVGVVVPLQLNVSEPDARTAISLVSVVSFTPLQQNVSEPDASTAINLVSVLANSFQTVNVTEADGKPSISLSSVVAVQPQERDVTEDVLSPAISLTSVVVAPPGLIHDWLFTNHSGDNIPDRAGANDLTNHGGSFVGDGLTLNGSTQYADSAAWIVGANNVTVLCWAKFTTAFQSAMFVEKETVNTQWELLLLGGGLSFRGGGSANTVADGVGPNDGVWHQLVGTINGTTGKIYQDSVKVSTTGLETIDAFTDASSALEIGRFNGGFFFAGTIGLVQIYNRDLSLSEIGALWTLQRGIFGV